MFKICSVCKSEKSVSEFRKRKASKDGYRSSCKTCDDTKYSHMCKTCGVLFKSSHKNKIFCSRKCSSKNQEKRINCNCDICGKNIEVKSSIYNKYEHHYCSYECKHLGFSKYYKGVNNPRYNKVVINCHVCNKEIEIPKYRLNIAKNHYCSYECANKGFSNIYSGENHHFFGRRHSIATKIKIGNRNKGKFIREKSPRWNPSLTDDEREKNISRHSDSEYIGLIKQVLLRDNYTCKCCGKYGGDLNVHHLNGWNWDLGNRYSPDNAITLCLKCHKDFHVIYGKGNNTLQQFNEFINNYNKLIRTEV